MGTPEETAAEDNAPRIHDVFHHVDECLWILQGHGTQSTSKSFYDRCRLSSTHPKGVHYRHTKGEELQSLEKHWTQGQESIGPFTIEFARLHEHPVTFTGVSAISYHHLVFELANYALHAVVNALGSTWSGLGADQVNWSSLDPDKVYYVAGRALALATVPDSGIKPPSFNDYDWLRTAVIQEGARLPEQLLKDAPPVIKGRDTWIYDQCMEGTCYDIISRELTRRITEEPECSGWGLIDSVSGIKSAAKRYADRHRLPPLPTRQPGRPKN